MEEPRARSRNLAAGAWLLWLTALWLPWWVVQYTTSGIDASEAYHSKVFFADPQVASTTAAIITGVIAAIAGLWLFVRLAGRSFHYEPAVWHRDLRLIAGTMLIAVLSTLAWPSDDFRFWGGRVYALNDTAASLTEQTMPGLGFWIATVAALLVGAASFVPPQE